MPLTPRAAAKRLSMSIAARVRGELAPILEQRSDELSSRLALVEGRLEEIERQLQTLGPLREHLEAIRGSLGALESLAQIRSDLSELRSLAESGLELEGEKTELFGRLLRTAASRVDELEERLVAGG